MFQKILIANRGEIACRVIHAAKRMGIATVAVYSDADSKSKHVTMADEAVHIGASAVSESYLRSDRIIAAALETGAQAIHPGYGFLSENPVFVDAVIAAGLVFIGPPASAIRSMGLKDAAKALMVDAGVPVVPGYHGSSQDPDVLGAEAEKIGYPVLIKARAGGGGKGMRLVEDPADFKSALEGARREGEASFGDPVCLIEKYITRPRHIEIQVFGDSHGNVIHLFERDCSLQRRHQKVIEEAPAPDMPEAVRAAMGKAAVDAAKAIGYEGAGTVEFIVDGTSTLRPDGFWFMEMNTRLQVEHPVTEAITGLDLVELQISVASGDRLPFGQSDLTIKGHSFEARIYAEDVPKGFLPATGTLDHLSFPDGVEFSRGAVRIDSGVREGDEISPYYDPMIAKLIVHGPNRAVALNRLSVALAACHVAGSVTNITFLGALARHKGFGAGEVDTGLIARDIDMLTAQSEPPEVATALAALASLGLLDARDATTPWGSLTGWRHWWDARHPVSLIHSDRTIELTVVVKAPDTFVIEGPETQIAMKVRRDSGTSVGVLINGRTTSADLVVNGCEVSVFVGDDTFLYVMPDALSGEDHADIGGDTLIAPMPGLVKVVSAKAGESVARGDTLFVLEAMKMEHTLTASRDGVVAEVLAVVGDQVTDGVVLLSLVPELPEAGTEVGES